MIQRHQGVHTPSRIRSDIDNMSNVQSKSCISIHPVPTVTFINRRLDGTQGQLRPLEPPIHILDTNVEVIQEPNKPLVTDKLSGAYNESSQPRGEQHQAAKINKIPCTDAGGCVRRPTRITVHGPGMEKIRNYLAVPTLENRINQYLVVYGMRRKSLIHGCRE